MRKSIVITEKAIYDIVYHQIATLLEESDGFGEYPIFNDWWIKMGEKEEDSDNIWGYSIWLFNGETYIDCFLPFEYCMTYAELAKGEVDCIAETTDSIVDTIYKYEED